MLCSALFLVEGKMALSPQFLDELKHRFTLSDVVGRTVKLARHGREHMGLCPFHNEKTPSFTVNDQKGFYHCFGCGAHGSVIDFVMGTQGMEFMEAVEVLAGEAGMEMPRQTPQQIERDKKRASLSEVMETVTNWYMAQLKGQIGRAAYDYIKGRGLTDDTLARFALGYAPSARTALKEAMIARGIGEDQLIETGMLIKPDDGASYDRFRDRLMFPITDRKGRVIAFGGRALSKDAKAKYLNSPETPLFHKGATLYNWANARAASYDAGQVMVVEGYMDVIALDQYGINYAVAPLGTALTEEQISHLWQMADEPILSFDGDKAGLRAANRAVERALPMLKPGKSLRFILMPDGDDPDSLVQREGKQAIEKLIDTAAPLVNMLWKNLTHGVAADTPERRAGLEKKIFGTLSEIEDENVKKLYQSEFRGRLWRHSRGEQVSRDSKSVTINKRDQIWYWRGFRDKSQGKLGNPFAHSPVTSSIANTSIGRAGEGSIAITEPMERRLVVSLVNHPELLVKYVEEVATLEFTDANLEMLRDAILSFTSYADTLDREDLADYLTESSVVDTYERLKKSLDPKGDWSFSEKAALGDAETAFAQVLSRYRYATAAWIDLQRTEEEFATDMTEDKQARYFAALQAFMQLEEKEVDKDGYGLESGRQSFN